MPQLPFCVQWIMNRMQSYITSHFYFKKSFKFTPDFQFFATYIYLDDDNSHYCIKLFFFYNRKQKISETMKSSILKRAFKKLFKLVFFAHFCKCIGRKELLYEF